MKRIIKKAVSISLASMIIFSATIPVMAASLPGKIHETREKKHISSGVVHENIERFTTSGWWNINVVRVDLKNPYTMVQGMINPSGLSNRSTVSNMVGKTGAVAGVNGDYFSYKPIPNPIGSLINKGEVISSPIEKAPYAAPSIFMDSNNKVTIGYMDRDIRVTNKTQNKTLSPYTINRLPDNFLNIGLLNKHWGEKSIGNRFNKDLVEVVVDGGVVTDIRLDQEPTPIPKDGYILFARGDNGKKLQEFQIGDELDLDIKINPDLENISFAIGGGSIILKDGNPTLTNINSGGNNPRTGIGVNKDNTELILVTIDGRGSYRGIGQKQFGSLMKELGAYNALNLDGGGSTTMALNPVDENKVKVVNNPSGGSERKVVNGVGVYSDAPVEDLAYIELDIEGDLMFKDTHRYLKVKGYDAHRHPINLDTSKLEFTVEGVEGRFDGLKLLATTTGKAKITAKYGDKTSSYEITVIDGISHLDTYMKEIKLSPGGSKEISNFDGFDKDGNKAKIYKEDVELSVVNGIGEIDENGVFHAYNISSSGAINARIGSGSVNILVAIGDSKQMERTNPNLPSASKLKDPLRKTSKKIDTGYSVGVTMDTRNLNDLVKYDATASVKNELNKHNVNIYLGGGSSNFTNGINNELKFHADGKYKKSKYRDLTLINLNTSKKGIRSTNVSQWNSLKNDLNNLDTKNLIISTSSPVFGPGGFTDIKEANLLNSLLSDLSLEGVNVFVVEKSNTSKSELRDGVRYISLNTPPIKEGINIKAIPILEFIFNGEDVSYEIRPLFK